MESTSLRTKIILLIIALVCFLAVAALAQGPGFEDDVVDTPFDGGATFIALAAAGYGLKKIRNKYKN